ncbi:MAG: class II aldolase/adducin family protein [Pirellulales bacterium]
MTTSIAEQLIEIGRSCWKRGWTRAGSCCYSLLSPAEPNKLTAVTSRRCRSKLSATDIQTLELTQCDSLGADLALHAWVAKRYSVAGQSLATVQTQSVWSNLLADRFATLDGVLLEDHQLLESLSTLSLREDTTHSEKRGHWLPIVPRGEDLDKQIAELEKALEFTPTDCYLPQAFIIHGNSMMNWAKDLETAYQQAEILEYFCEYLIRRALIS